MGQHIAGFIVKGALVFLAVKIFVLPAPIKPGKGQTVKHLPGVMLRAVFGQDAAGIAAFFAAAAQAPFFPLVDFIRRNARLAEIFLGNNIRGNLAPERRHNHRVFRKNRLAVRVADFAFPPLPNNIMIRAASTVRKKTVNFHFLILFLSAGQKSLEER